MGEQRLVLVGSYAERNKPGIYAFTFDETGGALTPLSSYTGIPNPSFLTVHPNGEWVYAVGEKSVVHHGEPGTVSALRLNRATGAMESINQQASGGDFPCHLEIDASGKWLLVANYFAGPVAVLPIWADGSLGELTDVAHHQGKGPNPERQESPHAHSTTLTPDHQFFIVADLGIDRLVLYRLDAAKGKLIRHSEVAAASGAGPRHLAFHPNGRIVYAANELANTVTAYDYDAAAGTLRERQTLDTLPPGASPNTVADIHISAGADRLYVSNRGHNSIAVFSVNGDGNLRRIAVHSCGGATPRNFALAPGGKFLLVANQDSGDISVLPVRTAAGELGAPVLRVSLPGASCVKFV